VDVTGDSYEVEVEDFDDYGPVNVVFRLKANQEVEIAVTDIWCDFRTGKILQYASHGGRLEL